MPVHRVNTANHQAEREPVAPMVCRGQGVLFPLWDEDRRGVPGDLVRGALFTIGRGEERRQLKRERVASLGSVAIYYTGEELRQRDADVFLQLVHLHRGKAPSEPVSFVARDVLKSLGWTLGARGYHDLLATIERLKTTSLKLVSTTQGRERGFAGSLIRSFGYRDGSDEGSRAWCVTFEPAILVLFNDVAYTEVDWQQRLSLSPMAKWLHSYYHTHSSPSLLQIELIHTLCGSTTKSLPRFKQLLKGALTELEDCGFLNEWQISQSGEIQVSRWAG